MKNAQEAILEGGVSQVGTLRLSEAPRRMQRFAKALRARHATEPFEFFHQSLI